MNSDEIRTGLGDLFVKQVIENNKYEYCNRSKAEAAASLAERLAISFYEWRSTCLIKNADQYTNHEMMAIYKKEKGLS